VLPNRKPDTERAASNSVEAGQEDVVASVELPKSGSIKTSPAEPLDEVVAQRKVQADSVAAVDEKMTVPARRPLKLALSTTSPSDASIQEEKLGTAPELPEIWQPSEISAAYDQCDALLRSKSVEIVPVDPIRNGVCGMPGPVKLSALGEITSVSVRPSATLNCNTVAQIHEWVETKVQPAARALLGTQVVRLRNVSSYACRNRNNASEGRLSEHALGNALDIAAFELADGRTISVLGNWGVVQRDLEKERRNAAAATETSAGSQTQAGSKSSVILASASDAIPIPVFKGPVRRGIRLNRVLDPGGAEVILVASGTIVVKPDAVAEPPKPTSQSLFLRRVHSEACGLFGTVLGPDANDAHRDHFHLDTAKRRYKAYCR
jgi:hypothetical protein